MRLQGLVLSRTFLLPTGLGRTQLLGSLRRRIGRPPAKGDPPAFSGTVDESGFEIVGISAYRSSFLPCVRGYFSPRSEDVEILLKMRPHWAVIAFLAIWYLFLALCAFILLLSARGNPSRLLLLLAPLGLGGLTWLLSILVFESDCRLALRSIGDALAEPFDREPPSGGSPGAAER